MSKKKKPLIPAPSRPVGRPSDYKPEFCEMLISHMSQGYSFESFAGVDGVDVHRDTLYAWKEKYKEFSDAASRGQAKCLIHWEKLGILAALNVKNRPTLNTENYKFNMLNRFRWRNKLDEEKDNGPQVNIYQSVMERIKQKKEQQK